MADIAADITVAFKGMQQNTEIMAKMLTGIRNMAVAVGVTAVFWQALEPLIKPVLMMLKAILLMLFLPLIPLLKPFILAMKDIMVKMFEAQKKAAGAGASPTGQFAAGLGVFIEEFMKKAGVAVFRTLFGIDIAAGEVTSPSVLSTALQAVGWGALAMLITAAFLGGSMTTTLTVGAITLLSILGIKLMSSAMTEGDLKTALLKTAGASVALGVLTALVMILLGFGGVATAVVSIAVGSIIFSVIAGWKIQEKATVAGVEKKWWYQLLMGKLGGIPGLGIGPTGGVLGMAGQLGAMIFNLQFQADTTVAEENLTRVGTLIGSDKVGSYPIVYSLNQAKLKWVEMASISINQINNIIMNLNRIPREIVTIHRIITVYETNGKR